MRRVVVIDDLPAFAETLSAMLDSLGYRVTVSTDARSSQPLISAMMTSFLWTY